MALFRYDGPDRRVFPGLVTVVDGAPVTVVVDPGDVIDTAVDPGPMWSSTSKKSGAVPVAAADGEQLAAAPDPDPAPAGDPQE